MSGHRKLKPEDVRYVRWCREQREHLLERLAVIPTQAKLAKKLNVSQATILHASQGTKYQDVD